MADVNWNFRPYKGADVGENRGRKHSKNLAIGNFCYEFNIFKV